MTGSSCLLDSPPKTLHEHVPPRRLLLHCCQRCLIIRKDLPSVTQDSHSVSRPQQALVYRWPVYMQGYTCTRSCGAWTELPSSTHTVSVGTKTAARHQKQAITQLATTFKASTNQRPSNYCVTEYNHILMNYTSDLITPTATCNTKHYLKFTYH